MSGNRRSRSTAINSRNVGVANREQTGTNDENPECCQGPETGVGNMRILMQIILRELNNFISNLQRRGFADCAQFL